MDLTRDEERILSGEEGETRRRAIELLVTLGDISDADRLIPISSAQVSGASYKTVSDAGLQFLEEFASGARAEIRATLNPIGMDRENWRDLGIPEDFAAKQNRVLDAYEKMGIELTCTCTPYLIGNRPSRGEDIAWAESSAVVFANSVLGARTNKEGGPSALAAAIVGKTPNSGLHIDENRRPNASVRVDPQLTSDDYTLLGHAIGQKIGQEVPLITGITPTEDEHKALGAAMAASGAASMYLFDSEHETCRRFDTIEEQITIEEDDLDRSYDMLNTASGEDADIIALGCPHLSVKELVEIATFLRDREPRKTCRAWFCVARDVARRCPEETKILRRFGEMACDTCMVVAPLEKIGAVTGTDSAKAGVYLPTLCKQKVIFRSRRDLLRMISK